MAPSRRPSRWVDGFSPLPPRYDAERGKFDLVFMAGQLAIRGRDNPPSALVRQSNGAELEPITLLAALAPMMRHIGWLRPDRRLASLQPRAPIAPARSSQRRPRGVERGHLLGRGGCPQPRACWAAENRCRHGRHTFHGRTRGRVPQVTGHDRHNFGTCSPHLTVDRETRRPKFNEESGSGRRAR